MDVKEKTGAGGTAVDDPPAASPPWLASYPDGVDWAAPISEEPLTLAFDRAVEKHGNRPCIHFLGKTYSYRAIGKLVNRAAKGFQSLGVSKGVKVGILLPNTPYFVICYYAILKAGGTVVNFNPLYVGEEIQHQIEDSETRIMVTLDLEALLPKASQMLDRTALEKVVVCSMAKALPFPKNMLFAVAKRGEVAAIPADGRHLAFEELLRNDGGYVAYEIRPREDVAVLQYTGGTTGVPKGAMLTHANIAANARQVSMWDPRLKPGNERVLGVLPLFHVFAMTVVMNQMVLIGAEMILLPRFELDQVLKVIDRRRPSLFPAVPTIYNAISHHPDLERYDLSCLELCLSGGAPLPLEVKSAFESLTGCHVVEGYGLSETSPVATCNPATGAGKDGSVRLPMPGTVIEIHDLENPGRLLAPRERGEIRVRGPQVMAGYWGRKEATAETMIDGALRTGDVGYMDEEGYVFLVDRIKDLIICGGYNVYPRVIEEAIYRHDSVLEVTVVGVPDNYRGEAPKAFVCLREGHTLTAEALLAFLEDKLSKIELPEHIEFRDELPKTMIGKLSKKELQAEERAIRDAQG
jgi:long-chain acyl-CoA synthetase